MKESLGEDFFNLWQKYYNKDLKQIAKENPEELEEIANLSSIFETHLPLQIDNNYCGTSPLYVLAMRYITNNLIKNLQNGQTMESAIGSLGKDIHDYNYKISQIKIFNWYRNNDSKIDWNFVLHPEDFDKQIIKDLYFGEFRLDVWNAHTIITKNTYGEYLQDMLNSSNSREDTYKDVKLSTVFKTSQDDIAIVEYPIFKYQKELFFQVLEKEWEAARVLINQRREGKKWTAYSRQRLDYGIATIAYLFANVMPFQRGSASATTALVYALYEMAGIQAPPVKIGRALDLSAFALDHEEYVKNWRNLFDGEFKIIK